MGAQPNKTTNSFRLKILVVVALVVIVTVSSLIVVLFSQSNDASYNNRYAANPDAAIHILADGDIYLKGHDSSSLPITHNGTTYNLVNDCVWEFIIETSNIVLDGHGFSIGSATSESNYQKIDLSTVSNVTIKNVNIQTHYTSVRFNHASNSIVENCTADNILFVDSKNNMVSNCSGGEFTFQDSSNNTVANCKTDAFTFEKSNNNFILNNSNAILFVPHDLSLDDSSNNLFFGNTFGKCLTWISMSDTSTDNIIVANNIQTGKMQIECSLTGNNTIYHNNFYNFDWNRTAASNTANTWNSNGKGNFWSDYIGTDKNGDGIGDSPYVIDTKNMDNFPLMAPVNIGLEKIPPIP